MEQDETSNGASQLEAMLRSHVERSLQELWDCHEVDVDGDGDYPWRGETAACWVGVRRPADEPVVQVFAFAATGVRHSAKLLTEINELNSRTIWARVHLAQGTVMVSATIHWTEVGPASLRRVATAVQGVADDIGTLVAAMYGGSTPFPAELESQSQDDEAA